MPFCEINDLVLHYRLEGAATGSHLVLSGSLGTDCRIWDGLVDELRGRFRILRYDQRGQGLSDAPLGPYSIDDHAGDLIGLLDRLGWERVVICGLSIGGMIALAAHARRPELFSALILSDTADVIGPRSIWDDRIEAVRKGGIRPLAKSVLERWFGASFLREQPHIVRGWANLLAGASVDGYLGSCAALRDADLGGELSEITAPTLCICGEEDLATPPALVRSLADRIPGARYEEMAGAGHLPPVERPAEFADLVTKFLEAEGVI